MLFKYKIYYFHLKMNLKENLLEVQSKFFGKKWINKLVYKSCGKSTRLFCRKFGKLMSAILMDQWGKWVFIDIRRDEFFILFKKWGRKRNLTSAKRGKWKKSFTKFRRMKNFFRFQRKWNIRSDFLNGIWLLTLSFKHFVK